MAFIWQQHQQQQQQQEDFLSPQNRTAVIIDYPQYTENWMMTAPSLPRQLSVNTTTTERDVMPSKQSPEAKSLDAPSSNSNASPAAGDAPAEKKRIRASKPKAKTGCRECKQRRVKCDEKRPGCTRCVKAKRECTGYPPLPRGARPYGQIKIAPKPSPDPTPQPNDDAAAAAAATTTPAAMIVSGGLLYPRRAQKVQQRSPSAIFTATAGTTPPHTPVLRDAALVMCRPMAGLQLDHTEGLYFQLFQTHTANELSGYFDDVFWSRMVLQECHTEDSIRHAVVALGALYKTLEQSSESPPNSPSESGASPAASKPTDHWAVAVNQYSNACNALVVRSGQGQRPHRTLLMATVLLACFDSFVGHHESAITQIQTGLGVLDKLRLEHRRSFSATTTQEPVEEELIQMFNRLAIQAKSYDLAFHFPEPYVIRLTPPTQNAPRDPCSSLPLPPPPPPPPPADPGSPPQSLPDPLGMPARFTCLREARLMWDKVCERLLRFTEILMDGNTPTNVPRGILPGSIRHIGLRFKAQLEAWSASFDHILSSRTAPGVSWQEKAGISVLKMFQIMTQIIFLMTFSDSELPFDNFKPQFRTIVDLACEVVGDEERRAASARCPGASHNCHHRTMAAMRAYEPFGFASMAHVSEYTACHIKPSFSADLGIIPPLFVVATKCRDRVIRRQAIQLLRSSARREAMWDSELTARVSSWVADVEEFGADEGELELNAAWAAAQGRYMSPESPVSHGAYGNDNDICNDYDNDNGTPVGPGGNAGSILLRRGSGGPMPQQNSFMQVPQPLARPIPEDKRIMVKSVTFDLCNRWAVLQVGTRSKKIEADGDARRRLTRLHW